MSADDGVKFRLRKGGEINAKVMMVEFGKLLKEGKLRMVTGRDKKSTQFSQNSMAELMHSVVALYDTCLSQTNAQQIYKAVCEENTKTLLVLRDPEEILHEWECASNQNNRKPVVTEINNNPIATPSPDKETKSSTISSPTDNDSGIHGSETDTLSPGTRDGDDTPTSSPLTEKNGNIVNNNNNNNNNNEVIPAKETPEHRSTPPPGRPENLGHSWQPWFIRTGRQFQCDRTTASSQEQLGSRYSSQVYTKDSRGTINGSPEGEFSDVFSDSDRDSDSSSDMSEADDPDDFTRGMDAFLRAVALRKRARKIAMDTYSLQLGHVGVEHRLIGCATFFKNYGIPGSKMVQVSHLAVRKRYRKCGIGGFLLKKLKSPLLVGPYDAVVVKLDNQSCYSFFKKCGFSDDVILNSRFKNQEEVLDTSGTSMCYLPPFDGHYPPLPGVQEWNRPEATNAMEDEIDKWRQKSLEAYQSQITCLIRLQQEVQRLHGLLRRQTDTIQYLKKENQRLQSKVERAEKRSARSLVEALEKEAEEFERLCNIHFGSTS